MSKKYDIAIKGGEYQNAQGETKARWVNLGAMMEGQNGPYLLLNPGVNLAAYMEDGRDMVIASLFEPRNNQQQGNQSSQPQNASQPQHGASGGGNYQDFDGNIPF